MIILGLDPSLTCTGWGVIRTEGSRIVHIANGQIKTDAKAPMSPRLATLASGVRSIIEEHRPDRAAAEEIFANKNAQSTIKLAQARGAVLAACGEAGLAVNEHAARLVKKAVVGTGAAEKRQVQAMLGVLLPGVELAGPDAADALAVAIADAHLAPREPKGTTMTIDLYGIPNCDTVRKARKWLDANGIEYTFHDFKKEGVDADKLEYWADSVGWQILLNRLGTTFRKLPTQQKDDVDRESALALMREQPSMIKRPVVTHDGEVMVGFTQSIWENQLGR